MPDGAQLARSVATVAALHLPSGPVPETVLPGVLEDSSCLPRGGSPPCLGRTGAVPEVGGLRYSGDDSGGSPVRVVLGDVGVVVVDKALQEGPSVRFVDCAGYAVEDVALVQARAVALIPFALSAMKHHFAASCLAAAGQLVLFVRATYGPTAALRGWQFPQPNP